MVLIFFKWFLISHVLGYGFNNNELQQNITPDLHPIYVSVTEIEHNAKEKMLEVSCKIFTDDFEKTLQQYCNCSVDLLHPKNKKAVDDLINKYIQQHLAIKVNGQVVNLNYVGYEQIEDAIYGYWQVGNVMNVKKIDIADSILYDYKSEQISMLHVTVNGNRKSAKLNNPDDAFSFEF